MRQFFTALPRRLLALATAVAVGMGLAVSVSPPASAATTRCSDIQDFTINGPASRIVGELQLCIRKDGNTREAQMRYMFLETQIDPGRNGNVFEYFTIQVRLERYDADHRVWRCGFTYQAEHRGFWGPLGCAGGTYTSSLSGGWTADGRIEYSYVDDLDGGHGLYTYPLHGSPSVS